MGKVRVIPHSDAYREGWERTFGDSGSAPVSPMRVSYEGVGRFPEGMDGPLGFVVPGYVVRVVDGGRRG